MFDVQQITNLHRDTVRLWHTQPVENPYEGALHLVCEQHKYNFLLWHEEDVARSPDVSDARIAAVKRAIDGYNQKRNDWIEKLDDYLQAELHQGGITAAVGVQLNTETPGSAIDRLSIMALRLYHMEEQVQRSDATPEHISRCRQRLAILQGQHQDLSAALAQLLADIATGRKQLKLYRQFKMYNDPTLNPYLYGRSQRAG